MQAKEINKILNINESFKMPEKLLSILLSDDVDKYFRRFIDLGESLDHDWFTAYFEEEHSNKTKMAQDFTPAAVCDLLAKIIGDAHLVADVCAGTGGLSIGVWNKDHNTDFICYEYSERAIPLLLFNMAIRNINATVIRCDVLTGEEFEYYKITAGDEFGKVEKVETWTPVQVDAVVCNPPYSMKYDPKADTRFPELKDILPTNYADYVFAAFALSILKDGGKAGFILPHGVLFRASKEQKMRQHLIDNGSIRTVIGLPGKLFLNTQIPTLIMELQRGRSEKDILFIDASKKCEAQRTINIMKPDDVVDVFEAYKKRESKERFATLVTYEDIVDNDYNLNIPRYVYTIEPEPPVDIVETLKELAQAEMRLENAKLDVLDMFPQLYGTTLDAAQELGDAEFAYLGTLLDCRAVPGMNYFGYECSLTDVADVERAKKGKTYPAGTVYVQVSATNGQVGCLSEPGEIEQKYATVIPKDSSKVYPPYLRLVLEFGMDEFLGSYQSTLNIQISDFKHFKTRIHEDYNTQVYFANLYEKFEARKKIEEHILEKLRDMKRATMQRMFPDPDAVPLVPEVRFWGDKCKIAEWAFFDPSWMSEANKENEDEKQHEK